MIKPEPVPCCRNSRGCCLCPSGERLPKKRSKNSSPNESNGLLGDATVFSTVIKTTAGVACRATAGKACESSRAADGTAAWGWAHPDMGRSSTPASSQIPRLTGLQCQALVYLWTLGIDIILHPPLGRGALPLAFP